MAIKCSNTPGTAGQPPKKKKFNKRKKSLLTKIKAEKYRVAKSMASVTKDADEAKALERSLRVLEAEDLRISNTADMIALKPTQAEGLGSLFANALGWKRVNPLNTTNNYSVAGEVRQSLLDERQVISNMLDDAGSIAMVNRTRAFKKRVDQLVKQRGIDKKLIPQIMVDSMEIGQIPKVNNAFKNSAGVEAFQLYRYNKWMDEMVGHGFSVNEITELRNMAGDIATAFDEMRIVAKSVGYDIPTLENLGYFPRIGTRDFDMRLRGEIAAKEGGEDLARTFRQGNKLSSAWDKMRRTHHYVPEVHGEFVADLLDIPESQLLDLFKNPEEWRNFLHTNVSAKDLDTLVDSGVFKRIPMTGREVFDYMVQHYELPHKYLNEMFITDPQAAIETYANGLKTAVANHAMAKMVVKDGMNSGWVMGADKLATLGSDAKNFVALGSLNLERWFEPEEIKAMGKVYVHKIVANQWRGVLELSSSPSQMASAARVWHYISTNLSKSALLAANGLYVGRIFLGNLVQGIGAGLDLGKLLPAFADVIRVERYGYDVLDNTKKVFKVDGEMLTKREYYRKYRLRRGDTIAPQTPGTKRAGIHFNSLNPAQAGKAAHLMWNYIQSAPDFSGKMLKAGEYGASLAQSMLDEAFAPFAYGGNLLDQVFKWATIQSVTETPGQIKWGKAIHFGSAPTFKSMEDVVRHVDDYYFQYSDIGTVTKTVGQFIRPFASWAMLNPPAQLRNMLRHPEKYLAYHKLLQVWNENETDGQLPEGGLSEYDLNGNYPIVLDYDTVGKEGFVLFPDSYDPVTSAFTYFRESGETIARQFGINVGTSKEQLDYAQGKNMGLSKFIQQTFDQSYFKKPIEAIVGVDFETGKKFDEGVEYNSYLGIPMSKSLEAFLSILPPVDALNRWNPNDVFGRKEHRSTPRLSTANSTGYPLPMTDGKLAGQEAPLVAAKPSIFGADRTDNDYSKLAAERGGNVIRGMQAVGMRVALVDAAKNMGFTWYDMQERKRELAKVTKVEGEALKLKQRKGEENSPQYQERLAKLVRLEETQSEVEMEMARIDAWMKENNIPPSKMLDKMKDLQLYGDQLPLPNATVRRRLNTERLKRREEIFGENHQELIERLNN